MSILSFIGLIALLVFGKFLWDNFTSSKQEPLKNSSPASQKFNHEPEFEPEVAIKSSPDKSGLDKANSLIRIAKNMNYSIDEAELRYKSLIYNNTYKKLKKPYCCDFLYRFCFRSHA